MLEIQGNHDDSSATKWGSSANHWRSLTLMGVGACLLLYVASVLVARQHGRPSLVLDSLTIMLLWVGPAAIGGLVATSLWASFSRLPERATTTLLRLSLSVVAAPMTFIGTIYLLFKLTYGEEPSPRVFHLLSFGEIVSIPIGVAMVGVFSYRAARSSTSIRNDCK